MYIYKYIINNNKINIDNYINISISIYTFITSLHLSIHSVISLIIIYKIKINYNIINRIIPCYI